MLLRKNNAQAATAFAYTNKEDGFKTQSPSSANYVEAVGKHFYGFIDDNGAAAGYTECLSSEQASKFLVVPFSTAAFDKTYSDILLLQRNGISNERINQLIAEPVLPGFCAKVWLKQVYCRYF